MNNLLFNDKGHCNKEYILKKIDSLLYEKVINFNVNDISWNQKVYNYVNEIREIPKCLCGNCLKFLSFKAGYRKYCSCRCATNSDEFKARKENTLLERYGVKNPSQSPIIQSRKEETSLKNYGVTCPLKSDIIKKRIVQTNNDRWGVDNVSQSDIIAEKKRLTNQKNHNVDYSFQSTETKKKISKVIKEKYGVDYYVQSKDCKLHVKNSINSNKIKFWANHLQIKNDDIIINDINFTIKNLCKIHNEFEISRYNLYNRTLNDRIENICTICNPISQNSSIKETELRNFIENDLNINTTKIKVNKKEIDIYLLDYKLGIEFDGLYWHSEARKTKNNYHLNKTELCEAQDIQLLHVFEDEWIFKKEIVKSIIKSKLEIFDNKILGEKCQIREIDSKLSSNFLDINHIEGNVNSNIKIGLFYNDELVSLMTFGEKRPMDNKTNIDGEYEMLRFCNKLNTQVIGGACKMLNYFIKTYNPKSIVTFADRRYSNGDLYKNMGFEFVCNTEPNYYFFKTSEMIRYCAFEFRNDVLVKEGYDLTKTEDQIIVESGYLKIYDCGYMKFKQTL